MNGRAQRRSSRRSVGWPVFAMVGLLLGTGCLAQKADLIKVGQDLDKKISKLDQKEKDIEQAIQRANEASARLHQDVSELREEDVAVLRGGLDKGAHERSTLRSRLDDLEHQSGRRLAALDQAAKEQAAAQKADRERIQQEVEKLNAGLATLSAGLLSATKALEARLQEQDKALASGEGQKQALTEQVAQLGRALEEFKVALNGLGEKLLQQEQRTNGLTEKVDADAKATTAYLAEVSKSMASVAKALETMGGNLAAKTEEQDRRIDELAKAVQAAPHQGGANPRGGKEPSKGKHGAGKVGQTGDETKAPRLAARSEASSQPGAASSGEESAKSAAQPVQAASASAAASVQESAVTAQSERTQPEAAGPASSNPRDSLREDYDRAMQKFKRGDLTGALQGFSHFLAQYPTSELASNAQYWMGECYYGKKEYARAIDAYDRVKLTYPTSEKVPAALLKKGFAYLAVKDRGQAASALRQVVDAYPKSPEAAKALDKLAQLK